MTERRRPVGYQPPLPHATVVSRFELLESAHQSAAVASGLLVGLLVTRRGLTPVLLQHVRTLLAESIAYIDQVGE